MFNRLVSRFQGRNGSTEIDLSKATRAELAILSRLPYNKKEREFIEMRIGVPIHKFSHYSSYLTTGCKSVWATYRACKILSAVILTAKIKQVKEGQDGTTDLDNQPEFLSKPNPYDSWEEVAEMWTFHMELCGNAYWLKDEIDMKGRPKAIYPLLPQHIKVYPDKDTKVARYGYMVNGTEIFYEPDEIIHFRGVHPTNLVMGMGSIEPSQAIYNEYINRSVLEEKFMENGAQLSGVLTRETEVADPVQWEKLKKKFNLDYTGKKNAGKVAFLNGAWKYHRLGMTMAEMQALEKEKWTIEQIFLNHGVPLSVAGIDGAANYATARQDEINFRKYKVVPLLDTLIGKLNSDGFFHGTGNFRDGSIRLTYEMSGLVDIEQTVKEYKPLVEVGAMTLNELREMCNLPVVDDPFLNQFYVNQSRVPLELSGNAQATDEEIEDKIAALRALKSARMLEG